MAIKVRVLLSSVLFLSTMVLMSCAGHYTCDVTFGSSTCTPSGPGINQGGGGNTITQTAFEYFSDDLSTVQMAAAGLNVGNDQAFLPISSFVSPPLPVGSNNFEDGGMVVVGKKFLYAAYSNNTVYGFSIDGSTAALVPVSSQSPYTVPIPTAMAVDPAGNFLFVGGSTGISVFRVNSDGTLTAVAGSPFSTTSSPSQMTTDGVGKYLYAVETSGIVAYSYDATSGLLTPVTGGPFQTMAQVSGESTGKYIIGITAQDGATSTADSHVYVFSITAGTGALTGPTAFITAFPPVNMAVSPTAAFVYTFEEDFLTGIANTDPMEGFKLSSTGELTALAGLSPFTSLIASGGKFDQSGQYLFVKALVSGNFGRGVYSANTSTGALTSTLPILGPGSDNFVVTDAP